MAAQDLALARKACEGDQDAFSEIYESNQKAVFFHILGMVGDRAEAEDLTQEVFLKAYQFMDSYSGDASLSRWLRKVATNLCIDKMRKKNLRTVAWPTLTSKDGEDQEMEFPDCGPSPLDSVLDIEAQDTVLNAIGRLPHYYRNVVMLYDVAGYRGDEVAEAVSCPVGTVKSRLSRAHVLLRSNLSVQKVIA